MGADEVNAFLSALATERNVSATTHAQALSALLFLYRNVLCDPLPWLDELVRARKPVRLPVVLTMDEVRAVLDRMRGPSQLVAQLLYGSGLRLLEALSLRVKDADFGRKQIHVQKVRLLHRRDVDEGFGAVWLPDALAKKLPRAAKEWSWQWIFPATSRWRDEKTAEERRHHLHETAVQKNVKDAARRAGIAKRVTCHTFRHSFATHLLERVRTSARCKSSSATATWRRR